MNTGPTTTRRHFLSRAAGAAATASVVSTCSLSRFVHAGHSQLTEPHTKPRSSLERLGIGAIGLRYQGSVLANKAAIYGDVVAVCDVDKNVRDPVKAAFGSTPKDYEDYRDLLLNPAVDIVTIGSPDHWHAKMLIDACRAGKDVYCEKPLTLTIDEGKLIRQVVAETGRVVQVGSWQRSDERFRLAVEMVRQGRIGPLKHVAVVLGKNAVGGPFAERRPPLNFNWDAWQGQATAAPYLAERSHYTFRWWFEYAGGQMTDWGAHHIDIAQWAIDSYPVHVSTNAKWPSQHSADDSYNVPVDFHASYRFANGITLDVSDEGRNGILFTGESGRIFVNRGSLEGAPVEALSQTPLPQSQWQLYDHDNHDRPLRAGKLDAIINHMGNFVDCVFDRQRPISDVESQHRSATTCHLGNLSMRVGRDLQWDPAQEIIIDDPQANQMLGREQRSGYEVV